MALDNKFLVKFMQLEIGPLQMRENVVGFEKALGAVKMIKDQINYRSQSLLNLARGYFTNKIKSMSHCISLGAIFVPSPCEKVVIVSGTNCIKSPVRKLTLNMPSPGSF